jgi:preprotein translocase subunit SecD
MATGDKRYHPMRMLIILTVLIGILIAFSGLGAIWGGGITPKFALDLAGGTQIILTPTLADEEVLTEEALDEAIAVIRQRVDASGVSEAEITKQGAQNIVVGIPGETPSDETIELISKAAQMRFRPVILSFSPVDETETLVNQKTLQDYAKYYASLNNSTSDIIQDIVEGDNTAYDWTPDPSDQATTPSGDSTTPSDLPTEPSETSNTSGISSHSISYSYNESNASRTQSYNPYVGVWTDHVTG